MCTRTLIMRSIKRIFQMDRKHINIILTLFPFFDFLHRICYNILKLNIPTKTAVNMSGRQTAALINGG